MREMSDSELLDVAAKAAGSGDVEIDRRGRETFTYDIYGLARFAALVRADEREACAKVCDEKWIYTASPSEMAEYIRARGQ
jgi:hypothetical protein